MLSQLALTDCWSNVGVVSARVKLIFPIDLFCLFLFTSTLIDSRSVRA